MASPATRSKRHNSEQPTAAPKKVRLGRVLLLALIGALVCVIWLAPAVPFIILSRWRLEQRAHEKGLYWAQQAAAWDDDNAEVHFLLARSYRRLGQFERTNKHLRRAHELGYPQWDLEREQLIALGQTGQYETLGGKWGMLLATAGSDGPEICNAYVADLLSKFSLQEAVLVLDQWMRDFPDDAQPHYLRGKVWEVIERTTQAEEEYRQALQRDPERHDVRFRLASTLTRQMHYDEAAEHLKVSVEADPENDEAAVTWAECLRKLGEVDQAREILEAQLRRNQYSFPALKERGRLELEAGNPATAVEFLERAVQLQPVDSELRFHLGQALRQAGREEEGQKELDFVAEANKPRLRLGEIMPRLVQEPGNIPIRFEVAETTWKYVSRNEGARWFFSLLQFDPLHAPTHRRLAEHFRMLNDPERAAYHDQMAQQSEALAPAAGQTSETPLGAPETAVDIP